MSQINITTAFDGDSDYCSICWRLQLTWFRNSVKELWNQLNNDRQVGVKEIRFNPNPDMPLNRPVTLESGTYLCATHLFNLINQQAEAAAQARNGPGLQVAQGSIEGLRKN